MATLPEPWMRGPMVGVDPLLTPVLYAFQQTREDLAAHTAGLTDAQLYARPYGLAPVAFHLRHIAGSVERLMSYLQSLPLSDAQFAALGSENLPSGPGREELLAAIDGAFSAAESAVRALDPSVLPEPRTVGRKRLPTTVIGLLTHIAEHTQRHVGQAITAAKLARAAPDRAER